MKYAAKMEQKVVPEGFASVGRFWGTWGKPEISRLITLPQSSAKHFVGIIRRAHIKIRKSRDFHRHFRDNGTSGFIAWESSPVVKRMFDEFFETGSLCPT